MMDSVIARAAGAVVALAAGAALNLAAAVAVLVMGQCDSMTVSLGRGQWRCGHDSALDVRKNNDK